MNNIARGLISVCLLTASIALPSDRALAARSCFGKTSTIVGTSDDDRLVGTRGSDVIWAGDGDDRVLGRGGNDFVCAGEGEDTVVGGPGSDRMSGEVLRGGAGPDSLYAAPGPSPSRLSGGPGDDWIEGVLVEATDHYEEYYDDCYEYGWCYYPEPDSPRIVGTVDYSRSRVPVNINLEHGLATGEGRDTLVDISNVLGSPHADTIQGGNDNNVLIAGGGSDTIRAGAGSDLLVGQKGNDVLDGESGVDGVAFKELASFLELDLKVGFATGEGSDSLAQIEDVFASNTEGASIIGTDFANQIHVGEGGNSIFGGAGDDKISTTSGRNDVDEIDAGLGDDYVASGVGDDSLAGGPGNDELHASEGNDAADGGLGYDVCTEAETTSECES